MAGGIKEGARKLSKEVVEQFEEVRSEGRYNMLDRDKILDYANRTGLSALGSLTKHEYGELLGGYSRLMKEYGIERKWRNLM